MKRKFMILFLLVIAMVASVFGVTACGSSKGITLGSTEVSIEVGGTATISATSSSGNSISWTSSDTSVATVSSLANAAIVKGVSEGESTLTATDGEYSATCKVTVTAATIYTILLNGSAVTSADVVRGENVTFTATASDGSTVSYWHVAETSIATVSDDGVVTGVSFGTTTLYAGKDSSHCNSITLNVVAKEGTVGYTLTEMDTDKEITPQNDPGTWYYWTEWSDDYITTKDYDDGTVNLAFTRNSGGWYNIQLLYKNSTLTAGAYLLNFKVNTTEAGRITVNGIVYTLTAGDNTICAPYYETEDGYSASIQIGSQESCEIDIYAATMAFSDFSWTPTTAGTLATPTLNVTNGVISITDTNESYKVGCYKLYLYDGSTLMGSVNVTNGIKVSDIDTSTVGKGTYTAYLRAIGVSEVYANSANSTNSTTIEVTEDANYALPSTTEASVISSIGTWGYNRQWWVTVSGTYADGTVTLAFDNNDGFWYDTQLFYKNPLLTAGNTYTLTFTLNLPKGVSGKITVNGTVIELAEGDNAIEVSYTESSGASISIQFGYYDDSETGVTEIKSAEVTLSGFNWELTAEGGGSSGGSSETYDAADFTTLVDTLDDSTTYTISHGAEADATSNAGTIYVWYIGDYEYWGTWADVTNSDVTANYNNGTITWSTKNEFTAYFWYANQLFYKNTALTSGTTYMLTLTIVSETAGSITINGTVVTLTAGTNNVTVFYTESGASLSIQLGVDGYDTTLTAPSLTISNINWYAKDATSSDDTETKEYEVSGSAIAASYDYGLVNGAEFDYNDTWTYWYVQDTNWGCGSVVTMSTATLENETITLTYTGGSVDYSVQLFYTNNSLTSGNYYRLTCTVYASVACNVTINGKAYALSVGNNEIEVDFRLYHNDISAFDMQIAGSSTETTIKVSNVAWYNLIEKDSSSGGGSSSGGSSATEPDTSNAVTVSLAFVESYGSNYFYLTATSTYDLTTASYVTVNGTKQWSEATLNGDGTYAFKVYVGDLTLSSYVFYWYDSTGTVVAMGTYSTTSSGDSGSSGGSSSGGSSSGDSGSTSGGVTLNATYVNFYGATWLEVQVVTELDLTTSSGLYTVKYNGSTAIASNIYYYGDSSNNTINIQVQISTETLTTVPSSNVITFYDANGNLVATVNYTP